MRIFETKIQYTEVGETETVAITSPDGIVEYLKSAYLDNPMQEQFWVVALNGANKPISRYLCTLGTMNTTSIHPREVFRQAIYLGAVSIIMSHNHPSESLVASSEDINTTRSMIDAGKILGIPVLDHVIVAGNRYSSLKATHPDLWRI